MRYEHNAVAWLIHDALIHPFTGALGLIGRSTGSLRLMTLALHIHNATAPSNDVLADYAQAEALACHNETASNPTASYTPDEQRWRQEAAARALGYDDREAAGKAGVDLWDPNVQERAFKGAGIKQWDQHADPGLSPEIPSVEAIREHGAEWVCERELEAAEAALERFLAFRMNHYKARDLREGEDLDPRIHEQTVLVIDGSRCVGIKGIKAEMERRAKRVQRARKALGKERRGVSVREIVQTALNEGK